MSDICSLLETNLILKRYFNSFIFTLFFPDHSYFSKWAVLLGPEPTEIKVCLFKSVILMITISRLIDDYSKDGSEKLVTTKMH